MEFQNNKQVKNCFSFSNLTTIHLVKYFLNIIISLVFKVLTNCKLINIKNAD